MCGLHIVDASSCLICRLLIFWLVKPSCSNGFQNLGEAVVKCNSVSLCLFCFICRWTGIRQSALISLQKQFGLSCLQGGILTASNSLALAANRNLVPCCCGTTGQQCRQFGLGAFADCIHQSFVQSLGYLYVVIVFCTPSSCAVFGAGMLQALMFWLSVLAACGSSFSCT